MHYRVMKPACLTRREWREWGKPLWELRPSGWSKWLETGVPAHQPLDVIHEIQDDPGAFLVRIVGGEASCYVGAADYCRVRDPNEQTRPAPLPSGAAEDAVTVEIPAMRDPGDDNSPLHRFWVIGRTVAGGNDVIRWKRTNFRIGRPHAIQVRYDRGAEHFYLSTPGSRIALRVSFPDPLSPTVVFELVSLTNPALGS